MGGGENRDDSELQIQLHSLSLLIPNPIRTVVAPCTRGSLYTRLSNRRLLAIAHSDQTAMANAFELL